MTTESKAPRTGLAANILSGLATSLFNVPIGLAYAQLAGVNPVYGLYAGIVPVFVAALTTGTVLMISTLTSSIALATGSVLQVAGIQSGQLPQALFTITFLAGVFMFVLGLLRLGSIVNFVSNAVMTGFVAGTALLIILGQEQHLTGYSPVGADQWQKTINWLQNIGQWDWTTVTVAAGTIALMVIFKRIHALEKYAAILVLAVGTIGVGLFKIPIELVGGIATVPSSLPAPMQPDFSLIPQLALGSVSVAFVALAQGAAVNAAVPNPDGSKSSSSRDFIGQGLGNVAGCFFQSIGTGGALSQTAVSAAAGATNRSGGVFAALWLGLIVLLFGSVAEEVPLAVIGGMLVVIGVDMIASRASSIRLVMRTRAWGPIIAMLLTFFSALFIPLQWTIFLGALLSLLLYVGASSHKFNLQQAVRREDGQWEMRAAPQELKPHTATVIVVQGLDFFAEVPTLSEQMPPARGVAQAVVILVLRDMRQITSTAIKWLDGYARDLKASGSALMLTDVNPSVLQALRRSGVLEIIGAENVFPATNLVLAAENMAWDAAQAWLKDHPV
jgi:sulfate permease, SulP family